MPGILHRHATLKALELLGPGAATTGFPEEMRRWYKRAADLEFDGSAVGCDRQCRAVCEECLSNSMDFVGWVKRPPIIPDAFRIHREHECCDGDEKFYLIDIIEIDGSSTLSKKLARWIDWADSVDYDDHAFMRLRIFNEHFSPIGEYWANDFWTMWLMDNIGRRRA